MDPENQVDVVIITALSEERDAVLRYVTDAEEVRTKSRVFHRAGIGPYRAVIMCMDGMGNVRAAAATQQAITVWNPAHIILTGIAGGIKKLPDARLLGDVLVAEQVIDYEFGKQTPKGMQNRYQVYRPAKPLLDSARHLPPDRWALSIKAMRPDGKSGRVVPQVHFGAVASGQKVVTDPDLVTKLQTDWAELIGIEMEGIGVALATYESGQAPGFLLVKGISDWADPDKADGWRTYAAEAAAAFALALLMTKPFESKRRPQPQRETEVQGYSGRAKISICRKLLNDWEDLADYFDIPLHDKKRFEMGNEPRKIWEWLEPRGKLADLPEALRYIGRTELAVEIENIKNPH